MLALGHKSLRSTGNYLENNIFSVENEENARDFLNKLFGELGHGRVDLTILAQLVRHGPMTEEMTSRLSEYRELMSSRVGVACEDPRNPPEHIAPQHKEGRLCGTHRCLLECPHARFLPESIDGIAMRVEELVWMSNYFPRETWLRGQYWREMEIGELLLEKLFGLTQANEARDKWRSRIESGEHRIPGMEFATAVAVEDA